MRWGRITILGLVLGLLQVSLLPAFRWHGAVCTIVLVVLVIAAAWCSVSELLLLTAICGVSMDLVSGGLFGLHSSALLVIALLLALLHQIGIDARQPLVGWGLVSSGSVLYAMIMLLSIGLGQLLALAGWRLALSEVFLNSIGYWLMYIPLRGILAGDIRNIKQVIRGTRTF